MPELDHVAIAVADLAAAKTFAEQTLGLTFDREFELPDGSRRVAFFHAGPARLEYIEDMNPERKRAVLGDATAVIEHIALRVGDLELEVRELAGKGVQLDAHGLVEIGGRKTGYTDPATSQGVMYQLLGKVAPAP